MAGNSDRRVVYKWEVPVIGTPFTKFLPAVCEWLTMREQGEKLVFWGLVDPAAERVERTLIVVGTGPGWEIRQQGLAYIGTVQESGGFVGHLFEVLGEVKIG